MAGYSWTDEATTTASQGPSTMANTPRCRCQSTTMPMMVSGAKTQVRAALPLNMP